MSARPIDVLRDLVDTLPVEERRPLHRWLALADRMLDPASPVQPITYVSAAERLRRARCRVRNPYYPGERDQLGRDAA